MFASCLAGPHNQPAKKRHNATVWPVYCLHWSEGFNLVLPWAPVFTVLWVTQWSWVAVCVCAHARVRAHVCILLNCVFNYLSIAQSKECRNFPVSDLEGTDHINTLVSLVRLHTRRMHSSEGRQWNFEHWPVGISLVAFNLAQQSPACPIPSLLLLSGPALLLSLFSVVFYPLTSTANPSTLQATIKDMRNQ